MITTDIIPCLLPPYPRNLTQVISQHKSNKKTSHQHLYRKLYSVRDIQTNTIYIRNVVVCHVFHLCALPWNVQFFSGHSWSLIAESMLLLNGVRIVVDSSQRINFQKRDIEHFKRNNQTRMYITWASTFKCVTDTDKKRQL